MKTLRVLLAAGAIAVAGSAHAEFVSCVGPNSTIAATYDISNKVSSATDCTVLAPLNGSVNDLVQGGNAQFANFTVNVQAFFGFSDWRFDGRFDIDEETETASLLNFLGDEPTQSGSFTLTDLTLFNSYADIMLVFKDGDDTNLVGYIIGGAGTYDSPFVEPPFSFTGNGPRDVSHISVYYRGTATPPCTTPNCNPPPPPPEGSLPEPGSLTLASLALLGLGFATTRRRRS